jgi:hypothetical protein
MALDAQSMEANIDSLLFQLGGSVGRAGEDDEAYGHRHARHNLNIKAVWTEQEADSSGHVAWTREFFAELEPHSPGVCT